MGCKLTSNITKDNCNYDIAGVKAVYLYNYDASNAYTPANPVGVPITEIELANDAKAYKVDFIENTASFTDELAINGNGGKYRTHTLNFTISDYDYQILNQGDALSLGKYTAVVVDNRKNCVVLGRNNGLSATSFNYASGAAVADANGWTVVMAGTEIEIGPKLASEAVIKAIVDDTAIEP
jgi:hypothetical protein